MTPSHIKNLDKKLLMNMNQSGYECTPDQVAEMRHQMFNELRAIALNEENLILPASDETLHRLIFMAEKLGRAIEKMDSRYE